MRKDEVANYIVIKRCLTQPYNKNGEELVECTVCGNGFDRREAGTYHTAMYQHNRETEASVALCRDCVADLESTIIAELPASELEDLTHRVTARLVEKAKKKEA